MTELALRRGLWEKARAGDDEARNEVLSRTLEQARARLAGRVPAHDLDDLVQRTGVSVLGFLDRGGDVRDFSAFAKYRALGVLSAYRKERRTVRSQRATSLEHDPEVDGEAASALDRRELLEAVRQCQAALSETLRVAFRMRWVEQRSAAEAARLLDVTTNAIHIRLFKAHQTLRECLRGKGFTEEDLGR